MRPKNKIICTLTLTVGLGLAFAAWAGIKVGDAFPDLSTYKLEGKLPDDLKGKVVMVDFWASWCGPCGESFPAMDEIQKKYSAQGLVIIAINVDEKKSDMDDFLKAHPVSFAIVRDAAQKLVDKAGIGTMPSSFLLGRDGKVVFAHSGFHGNDTRKQYEHEIESLLK
jgi:cytochrome c biogenesis protein CcmG, thiol:disulfide interchange protein DsbE